MTQGANQRSQSAPRYQNMETSKKNIFPLHAAARDGNTQPIRRLLSSGDIDIDARNEVQLLCKHPPLHTAYQSLRQTSSAFANNILTERSTPCVNCSHKFRMLYNRRASQLTMRHVLTAKQSVSGCWWRLAVTLPRKRYDTSVHTLMHYRSTSKYYIPVCIIWQCSSTRV